MQATGDRERAERAGTDTPSRASVYEKDTQLVRNIIADGCEKARKLAQETMRDVREAIGLDYS